MDIAKIAEFLERTIDDYKAISHAIKVIKYGVALPPHENDKVDNLLTRLDETVDIFDTFFNPKPSEEIDGQVN